MMFLQLLVMDAPIASLTLVVIWMHVLICSALSLALVHDVISGVWVSQWVWHVFPCGEIFVVLEDRSSGVDVGRLDGGECRAIVA